MFTGIIECVGTIQTVTQEDNNLHFVVASEISALLKPDQSLAHNGVCLTVTSCNEKSHSVTAVAETLSRTTFGTMQSGDQINLERSLCLGDRLDGHFVYGHVDRIGVLRRLTDAGGSHLLEISIEDHDMPLVIEKGSIAVNGVSLTIVELFSNAFSVALIPYTWQHTTLHQLKLNDAVNLEFDPVGKYIQRIAGRQMKST
ncbi:MAG: riboflavin synthase [Saprospiraceae bacterium]|nr:riboflavin synthase [Saprospiraceae bacterium]